jgi:hypothetical protein
LETFSKDYLCHAPGRYALGKEFLTYETTCTNEIAKRTTSENFCQKTPPANGGTLAQATHRPQGLAAWAVAGMWPCQRRR